MVAVALVSTSVILISYHLHRRLEADLRVRILGGGDGAADQARSRRRPRGTKKKKKVRFADDVAEPSSNSEGVPAAGAVVVDARRCKVASMGASSAARRRLPTQSARHLQRPARVSLSRRPSRRQACGSCSLRVAARDVASWHARSGFELPYVT
jgi:hypothetical protein